jgi:hypothetical protein
LGDPAKEEGLIFGEERNCETFEADEEGRCVWPGFWARPALIATEV